MKEIHELWSNGTIGPIDPITTFDISQLEPAMTSFSKGSHTGKFVITFDNPEATLKVRPTSHRNPSVSNTSQIRKSGSLARFDPEAAYILAGCLGGLGRSIATWMVERGARHLVFLSRSGVARPESTLLLQELTSLGAVPEVVECDITQHDPLFAAVEGVSRQLPIKGVIHAAMVEGVSLCTVPMSFRRTIVPPPT